MSVTFKHLGLSVPCADGESIFEIAQRAGHPLSSACGAKATCGLCRVRVVAGEAFLSPPNANEKKHLGNVYFLTKIRLGCQSIVHGGDVTVEVPDTGVKSG